MFESKLTSLSADMQDTIIVESATPTPTNSTTPNFPLFYKRQQSSVPKELCEKLGRKFRRAGLIRDHQIWTLSSGIMVYKNSFKGEDFLTWLMREQNITKMEPSSIPPDRLSKFFSQPPNYTNWRHGNYQTSHNVISSSSEFEGREEALDKGQWLVEHRVVEPVSNSGTRSGRTPTTPTPMTASAIDTPFTMFPSSMNRSFSTDRYYKLVDDDYEKKLPLNAPDEECLIGPNGEQKLINVREFNYRFCEVVDRIYAKILSEDKRRVHLDLLDEFEPFSVEYFDLAREMAHLDIAGANNQERLALFINLHNMMLIHVTYKYGLPGTIWQRRKYLYSTYYTIGGHLYSLQSIFNGILRGNRKGIGMLWEAFGEQDYRNEFVIKGGEPLVHFGLNNYTRSTPPIRTYSTENVYEELRANARECLGTKEFLQLELKQNKISMSKMFKQYSEDFGPGVDDVLKWVIRLLEPIDERHTQLNKMLCTRSYTLAFLPMDADLNMSYGVGALQQQTNNGGKNDETMKDQNSSVGTCRDWTSIASEIFEDDENF